MKSIYLLYGEERFLVRQELAGITAKYPGAETESLSGPAPLELLEKLFMPSLFSPQKVFVVHDFDFSQDEDGALSQLKGLPAGTALVFVDPQFDRRTKAFKGIEDLVEVVECKKLGEWDTDRIVGWIVSRARDHHKEIGRDCAEKLIEFVGFDLGTLDSEIEKIAVYLGERKVIAEEDLERMVPRTGYDIFSLSDALLRKDKKTAFASLSKLFADKEDIFSMMGFLSNQYRTLYKTKLLLKKRMNNKFDIARAAKASPYLVGRLMAVSPAFSEAELENSLNSFHRAARRLKTGADQNIEMYLLLSELLGE
ncbi:MAG TPA: DNA polymerase III subunit delta [Candidatus Omnitrophota bacterium]|nr:DNA polymerase III subunit delta [Candidatus Omnitrophota bacterium]